MRNKHYNFSKTIRYLFRALDVFDSAFGAVATFLFSRVISYISEWITQAITVQVSLKEKQDAYTWVMFWLSEQESSRRSSRITVLNRSSPSTQTHYMSDRVNMDAPIKFIPSHGVHYIRYKNRRLRIVMEKEDKSEVIRIGVFGRNNRILLDLIAEAREFYFKNKLNTTTIYMPDFDCNVWEKAAVQPKRPTETVVLREGIWSQLLSDAEEFLSSEDFYTERGIPYRRGYLLYGPPGSGKTSCVTALAGKLNLDISMINLGSSNMSDDNLISLLHDAPPGSIILLEDIDCCFQSDNSRGVTTNNNLTFSGLVNSIDGVATLRGRLIFMTTNHIEHLDYALIRPGRIDMKLHLSYVDSTQLRQLFINFYRSCVATEKLEQWANVFSKTLDKSKTQMTPATVQGFLISYKNSPSKAIQHIDELLKIE